MYIYMMMKRKISSFVTLTMLLATLSPIAASGMGEGFIVNGGFEDGIKGFGVCYSGRTDTVMPSISAESRLVSEGTGALELLPGKTLASEVSSSSMSKGFAYQGIYHKNTFTAKKGSGYVISADVYPKDVAVKARLLVMKGTRAVAASQEFDVGADAWSKVAFRWQPTEEVTNARVRLAFYQITEGKSIFVDALDCQEAILGNGAWLPMADEVISLHENNVMSFETVSNKAAGIYTEGARSAYTAGTEYALTGTVSTTAETAYITLSCASVPGCHSDYVLKTGETVQVQMPFSVASVTGDTVRFEIDAATTGGTVSLTDLAVVDVNNVITATQSGQVLTVSGQLRKRNENKAISVAVTGGTTQTVTTSATGSYTADITVPAFEGARKKVTVTISDINDYAEFNNQLSTDVYVINDTYFDDKATAVTGCTTAEEVKAVLPTTVLDEMGLSAIPVVLEADRDAVYTYLAGATVADGDALVDAILVASSWGALNCKESKLCDVIQEYGTLLQVDSVDAYKDVYAGADKATLNKMFDDSVAEITDKDSFAYALTEVLVRYVIQSKTTYAQQMEVLEKYADDLNLDFSDYQALSSAQKYSAATGFTKDIDKVTDYSTLQAKLDDAVKQAKETSEDTTGTPGISGGFGGGGSVGIYNENQQNNAATDTETQAPENNGEYRFADLDDFGWAQDSIYRMVEKGVISRPEDKQFHPGDHITRAEFAKMVAVLFDIDGHALTSSFDDVKPEDWYYGYVMALYEKKIVLGMNDTHFGSDEPISRQDICVILQRLLEEEPNGDETFTDMADIADYAKDSVRLMKKLGIINGYEDGSFRPAAYATRAEVAKILCGIE